MTRFVVDAPVLLSIIDGGAPVHPAHSLVAPNAVRTQALELVLARVRDGALDRRDALGLLDRVAEAKLRVLNDRVSRRLAWELALEHGWESLREAEYVAVTRLAADALVCGEPGLAARADGLVRLTPYESLFRP